MHVTVLLSWSEIRMLPSSGNLGNSLGIHAIDIMLVV